MTAPTYWQRITERLDAFGLKSCLQRSDVKLHIKPIVEEMQREIDARQAMAEPHPPSRQCGCADCFPSFEPDDAPLETSEVDARPRAEPQELSMSMFATREDFLRAKAAQVPPAQRRELRADLRTVEVAALEAAVEALGEKVVELERDANLWRFFVGRTYDLQEGVGGPNFYVDKHWWQPHSVTGEPTEWKVRVRGDGNVIREVKAALAAAEKGGAA